MTKTLMLNEKDVKKNKANIYILVIIALVFVFGMLTGAFSINSCKNSEYYGISNYFTAFIDFIKNSTFLEAFFNYFFAFTILILINFSLGLCLIGNYVLVIVLFLYSFAVGSIASFLYSKYSLTGVSYYLVSILPCLFLLTTNYLLCFKNSFVFSKKLFILCKNNKMSISFSAYVFKYVIHFIFSVLFSLLFALFSRFLVNLF